MDQYPIDGPVLASGAGRVDLSDLPAGEPPYRGLVFDATWLDEPGQLRAVRDFLVPALGSLRPGGRVVVLGTPPGPTAGPGEAAAQRALRGLVYALGQDLPAAATANVMYLISDAEPGVTLPFLLSARSAHVSGQVVTVRPVTAMEPGPGPRVTVVTGAAGGAGAAVTALLGRTGAGVIAVDHPDTGAELATVANDVRGTAVQLDLPAPTAPERLERLVAKRFGRLDVLVLTARAVDWDAVVAAHLTGPQRVIEAVLDLIPAGGRIVCVAAPSNGLTRADHATARAGIVGLVQTLAPQLAARGVTINAVLPTGPVDVSEAVAWLAAPDAGGLSGNVIRVGD